MNKTIKYYKWLKLLSDIKVWYHQHIQNNLLKLSKYTKTKPPNYTKYYYYQAR